MAKRKAASKTTKAKKASPAKLKKGTNIVNVELTLNVHGGEVFIINNEEK